MGFKRLLRLSFFFFLLASIVTCNPKEQEEDFVLPDNPCDPKLDIFAPVDYDLAPLGNLYSNGEIISFEFVTDEVAFAVGMITNGTLQIFKSSDGGNTWELQYEIEERMPEGMTFLNENMGIITARKNAVSCADCSVVLKTEDGGQTWEEHIVGGTSVALKSPTYDAAGNLFAVVGLGGPTGVFKSVDFGETWEPLFDFLENDIEKWAYSLEIYFDKIYVSTYNWPRIYVLNKSGELLETIYSASKDLVDFQVIDQKNIIVSGEEEMHRTISGGDVWNSIYLGKINFLGFTSATEGVFMLEKSNCPDRNAVNLMLVSTSDGGLTWNEAEQYTTLETPLYWNSQKTSSGKIIFLFGSKFYQLTRQ